MSVSTWFHILLFLMLLRLRAASGQYPSPVTVRAGDEVTLSCENMFYTLDRCDSTVWLFSGSRFTAAVELIKLGRISEEARSKSDRLSVTESCSLVIKKVTAEDAGRYICRQLDTSRRQQHQDSVVFLSVVTMTEEKNIDEVTLNCFVKTYGQCRRTVRWLYQVTDRYTYNDDIKTSESVCSATVTFTASKKFDLLKCEVTNGHNGKVQQFPISPQASGYDAATEAAPAATSPAAVWEESTTLNPTKQNAYTNCSYVNYMMLGMRVAELLLLTVVTALLVRAQGNQKPPEDFVVRGK